MGEPIRPKAVVLDFGGVLVEIHGRIAIEAIRARTPPANHLALDGISSWSVHHEYERGQMSTSDFCMALSQRLGCDVPEADFLVAWNGIFGPVVDGIEPLLEEISGQMPLYLLSNTNHAHWQHITRTYPFMRHFRRPFTSFELGARKPEPGIYKELVRQLGVAPGDLLFVDDLPVNVNGARATGLKAEVCLNSAATLRGIMVRYGVLPAAAT